MSMYNEANIIPHKSPNKKCNMIYCPAICLNIFYKTCCLSRSKAALILCLNILYIILRKKSRDFDGFLEKFNLLRRVCLAYAAVICYNNKK